MVKFLKKSKEDSNDSSVSSIPVPPADSALVIDLPEGQKLVLGKMEEGTVIEVATWRGTGRPDSRTNRLMLGVSFGGTQSNDEDSKITEESLDNSLQGRAKRILKFILSGVLLLLGKSRERVSVLARLIRSKMSQRRELPKNKSPESLTPLSDISIEEEFDIDQWLSSIRKTSRTQQLAEKAEGGSGQKEATNSKKASRGSKQKPRKAAKAKGSPKRK